MPNIDKVIVSSDSALAAIYGPQGAQKIRDAVSGLVTADSERGITTRYISIDRASDDAVPFMPVPAGKAAPASDALYKAALDAICQALDPQYLVILGAPDVIPHIQLDNPVYDPSSPNDDWDVTVPSDLPYACTTPYNVDPSRFVAPSRVVGRIPGVTGSDDPSFMISALATAASAVSAAPEKYRNYFAITAEVWAKSTTMSVDAVFGVPSGLETSPTKGPDWNVAQLKAPSHFINCHGASGLPKFLGEDANQYSTAHWSQKLEAAMPGVVVAAECCYGAQLYDPNQPQGTQVGIANTYLRRGAYGFFGSTNIAYGPADENAYADLLCQYFFRHLLEGSSLGLATLQARQDFVANVGVVDPIAQKTLAQFVLLGDPSIHPVVSAHVDPALAAADSTATGGREVLHAQRASRRQACVARARDLESCPVSESTPTISSSKVVQEDLEKLALPLGLPTTKFRSYSTRGRPLADQAQWKAAPERIHLLTFREETTKSVPDDIAVSRVARTVAVVAREVGGRIDSVTSSLAK